MELVIILAVVAVGVWYFFFKDKELIKEATSEAPYKVEDRPHVVDLFGVAVIDTVSSMTPPPVETKEEADSVPTKVEPVEAVKPKAKRAPRAKAETTTAKAKAPAKAPTKAKAPAKPRAKAPKMTVAK